MGAVGGRARRADTVIRMGEPERSKFDTVAAQYAAARPNYPAELFDAIGAALPRPWSQSTVLDVAAGTGISTRQLAERAGRVIAVELSAAMLGQLVASSPGIPAVQGNGNTLPVRDASVDLVTYAQAFHWVDTYRAIPEVLRVLRPDGVLALWWNRTDRASSWEVEQEQRIALANPGWQDTRAAGKDVDTMVDGFKLTVAEHKFPWQREIGLEDHLLNLTSKSYIAALDDRDGFIGAERAHLLEAFPSGRLTERFNTSLVLITR
jgi:SAM-dependent methyltransferase